MIKVGSDFSGVGAFNQALKRLGIEYDELFACDMDKYARQTFELNYGKPKDFPKDVYEREIPEESLDIFMTSPPCFTGDTLVNTCLGFKQIKDVKIGDLVLTHKNKYEKVVDFGFKESEVLILKAQGILDTKTTKNHRYYVREKSRKWNNEKRMDERIFSEPKWVEAQHLTKNHFIGINIPNIEENKRNITKEVAYVLGRYLADGWFRDRTNDFGKSKGNSVVIAIGKTKANSISQKIKMKHHLQKEVNGVHKLFIFSNKLVLLIKDLGLGLGSVNKRIPQEIINLPKDILQEFVNGYIDGDGHSQKDFFRATSVSKELLMGLQLCVAKLYNVNANIKFVKTPETTVIQGRTVNQRDYYVLEFRKEMRKQSNAVVIEDKIWYPVKKILVQEEKELVFDITVENDHSFTANQAIVHNCQAFSLAGKRLGKEDQRGILFFNSLEFIQENKPRYFIFENVKGLLSHDKQDKNAEYGRTFQEWINYLGGKSVNGVHTFFPIEDSVPYHIYFQVLNAKHYGIPQNRERVFIIGIRDDEDNNFQFPKPFPLEKRLKDVLESEVDEKYFLSDKMLENISYNEKQNGEIANLNKGGERGSVYSENTDAISCLSATDFKQPKQIQIGTWRTHEDGKGFRATEDNNCPTIPARAREDGSGQPVIKIGAIRGRNPENPKSRQSGLETEQMLEINENGTSNALTTVQKDNVVVIGFARTEEGKIKRKESLKKGIDTGSFSDREMILKNQDYSDTILANPNPKKEGLIITANTSKGFDEAEEEEDSINFSVPSSTTRRGRVGKKVSQTLDTQCNQGIYTKQRIRRLTPLECFKLMDFNFGIQGVPDFVWDVSDSQAYKQAGNSICVGVLAAIISKLKL